LRAFRAGALGYLLKNSAATELADAIRSVHAGKRYVDRCLAVILAEENLRHFTEATASASDAPLPSDAASVHLEHPDGDAAATINALPPRSIEDFRSMLIHRIEHADAASLVKVARSWTA
jgi:DNA-binding NarL/FixJ family response regulator